MTDMQIIEYEPSQAMATEFPEFDKIKLYGSAEDPLFPVQQVENALQIDRLRLDKGVYCFGEDYVKVTCVAADGKLREQNLLTEAGLYHVMGRNNTPVCKKFRRFTKVVLSELRLRGEVTVKTALEKLKKYEDDLAKANRQLEEEHAQLVQYKRESERFYLQKMAAIERAAALEMQIRHRDERGDPGYLLDKLKEMYMKKVYVYIAKPPKEVEEDYQDLDGLDPSEDDEICFELSFRKRDREECTMLHVHKAVQMETLRMHLHNRNFTLMVSDKIHPRFFTGTIEQLHDAVSSLM